MKICSNSKSVISQFKHLKKIQISSNIDDGFLNLFILPINARKFNYDLIVENLINSVSDYALSWETRKKFEGKIGTLSSRARNSFRNSRNNKGELGELLLFCFLEGFCEAPKILTKLELKMSGENYTNGSDGVHIKIISHNKCHLIFGESKMYKKLNQALDNAFSSLNDFAINSKNKRQKGIELERILISNNLEKEHIFEDNENHILEAILYPSEKGNENLKIDDAFSIFVGYEIDISEETKTCNNEEFSKVVEQKVIDEIDKYKDKVFELINKNELMGYTFYIFVIPFTKLDETREYIMERILK